MNPKINLLSPEELVDNYERLLRFIETTFGSDTDRGKALIQMYKDFEDIILYAPASGNIQYHNCYIGGYIDHVMRVIKHAYSFDKLWKDLGNIPDYTLEELLFVALNHDLGKIGDLENPYYIETNENWKNQRGQFFEINPKIKNYMSVPDRTIWLLQTYGIKMTETEYLGILLHDGLYDEANKPYLYGTNANTDPKSNLIFIMQQADMCAARLEKQDSQLKKGVYDNSN